MQLYLSKQFASTHPSYRSNIRKTLQNKVYQFTGENVLDLTDLSKVPRAYNGYYASISHCKKIGGFVLSNKYPIGFDAEETCRVKKSIYDKIACGEDEKAIEPSKLWTLKEASIKSLHLMNIKASFKDIRVQSIDTTLKKTLPDLSIINKEIHNCLKNVQNEKTHNCLKSLQFDECSKSFHLKYQSLNGVGVCLTNPVFTIAFTHFE